MAGRMAGRMMKGRSIGAGAVPWRSGAPSALAAVPSTLMVARTTFGSGSGTLAATGCGGERRGMATNDGLERKEWRNQINDMGKGPYKWLLKALGGLSEDARLARSASILYMAARNQAGRKEFFKYCGLQEDFSTCFYLECLHVWMLLVRLRREGSKTTDLRQDLFDRFWEDITKQIHQLGVKPIALSSRVRELQNAFYGSALAYDHSLGTDDALLAAALYRNLYGHEAKAQHLLLMTNYVRRELDAIDKMDFDKFLDGDWSFGSPHDL